MLDVIILYATAAAKMIALATSKKSLRVFFYKKNKPQYIEQAMTAYGI
jgi:hypothetical protein